MTLADAVPALSPVDRKPRRRAAAVAGVVGVSAAIGVGAWTWQAWSTQGPQPAEALPASTLAYIGVDLDPPGGQKVAAYDALRKFPAAKKDLKLNSQDDLRRSLLEAATEDSGCDVDFDDLVPWAGDRAALAVVPVDKPEAVVLVQIGDQDKAKTGLAKLAEACGDDDFGFAIADGWALLARNDAVARQVKSDAAGSTLAEDADYRELTGAAGDAGVVTLFAAPEAGKALIEAAEEDPFIVYFALLPLSGVDPISSLITLAGVLSFTDEFLTESSDGEGGMPALSPEEERLMERFGEYDDLSPAEQKSLEKEMEEFYAEKYGDLDLPGEDEIVGEDDLEAYGPALPAALKTELEEFSGIGGVLRFEGEALELEVVADPILGGYGGRYDGTDASRVVAALPADTAVAFGGGLADGWANKAVTDAGGFYGLDNSSEKDLLAEFKKSTGLTPKDLEALGGEAVAFLAKSGFEKDLDSGDAATPPIAARVTGDAAKIEASLAKLRATLDSEVRKSIKSRRTNDGVAIGPDAAYLDELVDPKKTLGDTQRFTDAVPEADGAVVVTFADFDAGAWLDFFAEPADSGDLKPLDAAGLTVTRDGDQHRFLLRVTLD